MINWVGQYVIVPVVFASALFFQIKHSLPSLTDLRIKLPHLHWPLDSVMIAAPPTQVDNFIENPIKSIKSIEIIDKSQTLTSEIMFWSCVGIGTLFTALTLMHCFRRLWNNWCSRLTIAKKSKCVAKLEARLAETNKSITLLTKTISAVTAQSELVKERDTLRRKYTKLHQDYSAQESKTNRLLIHLQPLMEETSINAHQKVEDTSKASNKMTKSLNRIEKHVPKRINYLGKSLTGKYTLQTSFKQRVIWAAQSLNSESDSKSIIMKTMLTLSSRVCLMFVFFLTFVSIAYGSALTPLDLKVFDSSVIEFVKKITDNNWSRNFESSTTLSSLHSVVVSELVAMDVTAQTFYRDYGLNNKQVTVLFELLNSKVASLEQGLLVVKDSPVNHTPVSLLGRTSLQDFNLSTFRAEDALRPHLFNSLEFPSKNFNSSWDNSNLSLLLDDKELSNQNAQKI